MDAKMKLQSDEKSIINDILVGVTNIASSVPIICSFRILPEKLPNPVNKKVENATPIRTKEK